MTAWFRGRRIGHEEVIRNGLRQNMPEAEPYGDGTRRRASYRRAAAVGGRPSRIAMISTTQKVGVRISKAVGQVAPGNCRAASDGAMVAR